LPGTGEKKILAESIQLQQPLTFLAGREGRVEGQGRVNEHQILFELGENSYRNM